MLALCSMLHEYEHTKHRYELCILCVLLLPSVHQHPLDHALLILGMLSTWFIPTSTAVWSPVPGTLAVGVVYVPPRGVS